MRKIKDITDHTPVEGVYVASDVVKSFDRNGHPYWSLNLVDDTGSLPAKIWSNQQGRLLPEELGSRDFVRVRGQGTSFRGQVQVKVDSLQVLGEEEREGLAIDDFFPPSPYNGEAAMDELMDLVHREIAGTPWERLVDVFFGEEKNRRAFVYSSAARSMHHAGRGGLVVHVLEICRICLAMADLFPELDRPTLVAGALFHDIGKLDEMHTDPIEITYTTPGNLIGHIVLGVARMQGECERAELPVPLREHLFHLILSHHGRIDYGAVKEPATREAVVLAQADYLSAKLNTMRDLLDGVEEGQFVPSREYGKTIFKAPVTATFMRAANAPCAGPNPASGARDGEVEPASRAAGDAAGVLSGDNAASCARSEDGSTVVSDRDIQAWSEPQDPQWEEGYLESLADEPEPVPRTDEAAGARAANQDSGRQRRGDSLLDLLKN